MGTNNMVYEWEGDSSQALGSFTVKTRVELLKGRERIAYGRIIFKTGDFDAYWALVKTRNDVIARNKAKISQGAIDGAGGATGGGYWFGEVPIAGSALETVPDEPVYAGDQAFSLEIYMGSALVNTIEVYHQKPFRLGTSGQRNITFEAKLIGNVAEVHQIDFGASVKEVMAQIKETQYFETPPSIGG